MRRQTATRLALLLVIALLSGVIVRLAMREKRPTHASPESPAPVSAAEQSLPAEEAPVSTPELPSLELPVPTGTVYPAGPLEIHEITLFGGDRVELKNISDETLRLSDYYLTDKEKKRLKLQLPDVELEPGAFFVAEGLSLSVRGDELWLCDGEGRVLDYALAQGLPAGGSYGRLPGESGWFYFASPSLGEENSEGFRRVTEKPRASVPGGVFDGVESVTVELKGPGVIYYTTDGRAPSFGSEVYTEPLELKRTTILRAVAVEEGALPSRTATFHFFLNEYHSLPIVSFCSDDVGAWYSHYWSERRDGEYAGAAAMFADGKEIFNQACGLRLRGFSAVGDKLKKNIGLYFRGDYGDGALRGPDLFGTGITEYRSLALRAGGDHWAAIIRSDLMEELCLQASEHVPVKHGLYCVMYMNGEYRGIYSLKENMNEDFFADWYGVSPESFTILRRSETIKHSPELQELFRFCTEEDMSDPERYEQFCGLFDIDNFIDYVLLEGFSGNTDMKENVGYFRSDEMDGRWRFAFYDLDCSFYEHEGGMRVVFTDYAKPSRGLNAMLRSLCRNEEFRDRLLRRYAAWIRGPLSPENMLRTIDRMAAEIEPEVPRDRMKVGIRLSYWYDQMEVLRSFATEDYLRDTVDVLCRELELSEEERTSYFGEY